MARPEGFEPPAFGIGIHCDIQLRHGRSCAYYYSGFYAVLQVFFVSVLSVYAKMPGVSKKHA